MRTGEMTMAEIKRQSLQWERWIRCGEYEIKKIGENEYITPVRESGFIRYSMEGLWRKKGSRKPDENYIVQRLLNLDTSNRESIIEFVNQFGLLGIMQHDYQYAGTSHEAGKEHHFVSMREHEHELNLLNDVADLFQISIDEYVNGDYRSMPLWSEPLSHFIQKVKAYQSTGHMIAAMNKCVKDKQGGPLRKVFLERNIPLHKEWAHKLNDEELISKAAMLISDDINSNINHVNRQIQPEPGGKWRETWGFESLLSAVYFLLSQDLTGNYWIGQCLKCGNYFISSVGSQIHCSRKCEDAARKAKSREKLKEGKDNGMH
jgi:hypothetical protein